MTLDELKLKLRDAGVAGAGGAGFPTYAKLTDAADTIILNCAECEPLLKLHRQVLAEYAYEILSALDTIKEATGAKEVIIALKETYKDAINAVNSVLNKFNNFSISYLPEVYPAGDELVVIYETTGKVVQPGKLPISVGVTVLNVETALNVYNAINSGSPVTHSYVTITGAVNNPITVKAPLGMSFKELIKLAGGSYLDDYSIINGGPLMGKIVNELDTVTKTTTALLVLPNDQYVIKMKKVRISISLKRAMASCCQCRSCTNTCSRNLLGHPIEPHAFMRSATSGGYIKDLSPFLNTFFCSGCGICELYSCPQGLSPRTLITEYKMGLRKNDVPIPTDIKEAVVDKHRNMKMVPISRLTSRLGLSKYDNPAPLSEDEIIPKKIRITFDQNIGVRAKATVKKGDLVSLGQVVADVDKKSLGLPIHSSIDGIVVDANEHFIIIKSK